MDSKTIIEGSIGGLAAIVILCNTKPIAKAVRKTLRYCSNYVQDTYRGYGVSASLNDQPSTNSKATEQYNSSKDYKADRRSFW